MRKQNLHTQINNSNKTFSKILMFITVSSIFGLIYSASLTANSCIDTIKSVQTQNVKYVG